MCNFVALICLKQVLIIIYPNKAKKWELMTKILNFFRCP